MDLSLVIPVYNEEENVPLLYPAVTAALKDLTLSWEMVLVDDGSRDSSLAELEKLAALDPARVRVVALRRNFGQTAAIAAGIDYSTGAVVVLMDADLQNDPADIPMMLEKLDEGYDVVSGWRKARQDTLSRRLPSQLANGLISRVTGVHLHDYGCTLKAYRREVLNRLSPVRGDAPLHPGLRQLGRGAHPGSRGPPPRPPLRQGQIRPGTDG